MLFAVVNCGIPPLARHGNFNGRQWTYMKTLQLLCTKGYALEGSGQLQCQLNGSWSIVAAQCVPVQCPVLPIPRHATLSSTNTTYTVTVHAACVLGYRSVSEVTHATCLSSGLWSGHFEDCQVVECPVLLVPTSVTELQRTATYGGKLVWSCSSGYTVERGNHTRQCQANGQWSGEELKCKGTSILCLFVLTDTEDSRKSLQGRAQCNIVQSLHTLQLYCIYFGSSQDEFSYE